ncbi:MAG: two-component system, NtrC family, sensor kinase [Pyrinomonadaceae bacterium]|nr:two-component system, NtrC family, sensor kinase [Pyrinomonadaceae bacterium]
MNNPETAFAIEPIALFLPTQLPGNEPADAIDLVDRRILIVDDEEGVRNLFADWLSENYECQTAASAEEALEYLAGQPCALVISDMMMPGRNGVELLREVTSRYPETAFIMVSGVDRPQRVRDALRVGAFDYLIKPCELDGLTTSVERALERRALQRTARIYKTDLERQNIELANSKAELERLQAQLVQNEKMASLGQLAAGVAHELNNPAGFIYGNMDILAGYLKSLELLFEAWDSIKVGGEYSASLDAVETKINYTTLRRELSLILADCREGAARICDVVKNLRLFSRLDEAEFKSVDINEGISSTLRLLSQYYSAGSIVLEKHFGNLPLVDCYASQLNQVWMNLLVNAAQAVGDSGQVTIETKLEGNQIVVVIADTGSGIPDEQISKIFDPFFTTKPVGVGTGLGLSTSYGIVEKHCGTISVRSKLDQGTTFTVQIPVRQATHK